MKWIKRLLLSFVGVILVITLILIGTTQFLDETHYKNLLIWAAKNYLNSELQIHGPFELEFSENTKLTTNDISLNSYDNDTKITIGKLLINFRLSSYIDTGVFWFNELVLEDVNFLQVESIQENDEEFDFESISLPPVVINNATFKNIKFSYQEQSPGSLHNFYLGQLDFKEQGLYQPVLLEAIGEIRGKEYHLNGEFGSIRKHLENKEPIDLTLSLNSEPITVNIQGKIDKPLTGHGLDLQVQSSVLQLQNFIEIVWDEIPVLGELQSSFKVYGDYSSPQLKEIEMNLQRDDEVNIHITGAIEDALNGKGFDLRFKGNSTNPEVLSWFLFKQNNQMQSANLEGELYGDLNKISLQNLNLVAKSSNNAELQLSGNADLHPEGYTLTKDDADLNLKINAPSISSINFLNKKGIPDFGFVDGSLALAVSQDSVSIYNADIKLGEPNKNLIQLKGDIGVIPFKQELTKFPELKLNTDIQFSSIAQLNSLFDLELPKIGPVQLTSLLVANESEFVLQNTNLHIGKENSSLLQVNGMLAAQFNELSNYRIAMDVDLQSNEITHLGGQFGVSLPDLGPTHISGWLKNEGADLIFNDVVLVVGSHSKPTIHVNGKIITQFKKNASHVDISFDVGLAPVIAAFTELQPHSIGRLQGDAVIANIDGDWGVESFNMISAETNLYELKSSGIYDDFINYDQGQINSYLLINNMPRFGDALGIDLHRYSSYKQQGEVTIQNGRIGYEGGVALGKTISTTKLSGVMKNGKPTLEGNLRIPKLYLEDIGLGVPTEAHPGTPDEEIESEFVFSRESFTLDYLNLLNLNLDLVVDEVIAEKVRINSINGHVNLQEGHLKITPLNLFFEGGHVTINSEIKSQDNPEYKLSVSADDLRLAPLMSQITDDVPISGFTNTNIDLTTSGSSHHQMASNLSGDFDLVLENAQIPKKYIELLSVDIVDLLLPSVLKKKSHSNLNCVVMIFDINQGDVKSETIIADGPNLVLAGQINFNLAEETVDTVLLPKRKKRILSSVTPVKVQGPMKDPHVKAIPAKAAIAEIGGATLFSSVYIPLRLGEKLWGLVTDGDNAGGGCEDVQDLTEEID